MFAVMAAMFMIAIEATIVSTAMPQIAAQLGDLRLYSWVFAAFLLAQTATTMVFGKLSDMFGRKPVLLVGIAIFLVGSVLCGFAWSMPSLIVVPAGPGPRRRRDPADRADRRRRPLSGARSAAGCRATCPASGASPRCSARWPAG